MKLVFLFDEFECVTKNERLRPEFYSFLRSLANTWSVGFITASGRDLKDMCASHDISDSPFFNIFSVLCVGLLGVVRPPGVRREEGRGARGKALPREIAEAFREEARPHFEFILENLAAEKKAALARCLRDGRVGSDAPGAALLEKKGYLARSEDGLVPFSGEFAPFLSRNVDRPK